MNRRRRNDRTLWRWVLLAAGLHALAAGALLIGPRLLTTAAIPSAPEVLAEVELVTGDPQNYGDADPRLGGAGPAAPPETPAVQADSPPTPAYRTPPLPPPAPDAEPAATPPPAPAAAPEQNQAASVAQQPTPAIRLGDDALPARSNPGAYAFGDAVVPAEPDAAVHNTPPAYPKEAARRGEQGTVVLDIHVSPDGSVSAVDVETSSGSASLDHAARTAAARWRFRPALQAGAAVASDFLMRVTFEL